MNEITTKTFTITVEIPTGYTGNPEIEIRKAIEINTELTEIWVEETKN